MSTQRIGDPAAVMAALNGSPVYLGTITATTTKNNHDTAVVFNNTGDALKGRIIMVQCDTACYVLPGTTNAGTVTAANGVKLAVDERVIITMTAGQGWLACLAVTGTTVLKVWELV